MPQMKRYVIKKTFKPVSQFVKVRQRANARAFRLIAFESGSEKFHFLINNKAPERPESGHARLIK